MVLRLRRTFSDNAFVGPDPAAAANADERRHIFELGRQAQGRHCVLSDHSEAVTMAARTITQCGHRRIGLAIEKYQDNITDGRWSFGYAGLSVTMPSLAQIPPLLPTKA